MFALVQTEEIESLAQFKRQLEIAKDKLRYLAEKTLDKSDE